MGEFETALKIARGKLEDRDIDAEKFGSLYMFSPEEKEQLPALKGLIVQYVNNPSPKRPLCLAIFGPPGSGKSFAATEICSQAKSELTARNVKLPMTAVNMTQFGEAAAVSRVFARVAGEQDRETVPVIFIDEFDAPRDGAPYGWLSWFLAPMHDGEFSHDGATIRLTRAVYVFAGGTADTMEAFSAQRSSEFRSAKGPDFVSRLRGYLDVQGPNQSPREIRRAIILNSELNRRLKSIPNPKYPAIPKDMLESLLKFGRYRHGARSIAAIVEMSDIPADGGKLSWEMLPKTHLLKLHIDRGTLDSERIDGAIALSGYNTNETSARACWRIVAKALWDEGATLAYVWVPIRTQNKLMNDLADDLTERPVEPTNRAKPGAWLLAYTSADMPIRRINKAIAPDKRIKHGLLVIPQKHVGRAERRELGGDEWKISMVSRFRRRFAMSEASAARFAVGGWKTGHKSRVPGIAEEVMLTLAFKRPVYIAGGFGGAAADLGVLLGLSNIRTGGIPESFAPNPRENELSSIAKKFQPPSLAPLPVTSTAIVDFLEAHGLGSSRWPENGLSRSENKRLFVSKDPNEISRLIVRGLSNCSLAHTDQA